MPCTDIVEALSRRLAAEWRGTRIVYVRREVHPDPEPGPGLEEAGLHPSVAEALRRRGIERLYRFQWEAYRSIRGGRDTVIVSGTGTGKTEAFLLPILQEVMEEPGPGVKALVVYPTKALARDQLSRINSLIPGMLGLYAAVYDGDTPEQERRRISQHPPQILVTNPDMIHVGLVYSKRFRRLISTARYVVLDEAHVYEGALGSHVKAVLERLEHFLPRRPVYVASGATIGNPEELGELLFGSRPRVVKGPEWRRGEACHVLVSTGGYSRWSLAAYLAYRLNTLGLRVLVFTDSQQMAEVVARIARRSYGLPLEVHRAGLRPEERRRIEEGLRRGEVPGVAATPTLELGIDIGVLDAIVMAAPPPSYTKYLQRAGRAGRRGRPGIIVTLLGDDPIDTYYERRPAEFFERGLTPTLFEPDNEEILRIHAVAMLLERVWVLPDRLPERWRRIFEKLVKEGLARRRGRYIVADRREAYRLFKEHSSIRGAGPQVQIVDEGTGRVIGSRELPLALYDLHPDAVYLHGGRVYRVLSLDPRRLEARVARIADDHPFYTRPLYTVDVAEVSVLEKRVADGIPVAYVDAGLHISVDGYMLYSLGGEKPLEKVLFPEPVTWSYRTRALIAVYPVLRDLGPLRYMEAIHALEHTVISAARIVAGAGMTDLGGISYPSGHVVIYDSTPGGSGLARLLYRRLEEAHRVAREILAQCSCEDGCPRCVYSPYCGNNNRVLSRTAALRLVETVLRGVAAPEAEVEEPLGAPVA